MSKIITQNDLDAKLVSDSISNFFARFHIAKELKRANAQKEKGFSPVSIFQYLFLLVFSGKSMYMDYLMGKTEGQFAKDTVYRFMKSIHINWLKFTTAVASRVANEVIAPATDKERVNAFIIDDSVFSRCRSKSVELLAKIYDHAGHKYLKGFRMLTLGWTDGNSFVPVNSVLLSSEKQKSRINEVNDIDKRTNGYRRRSLAMRKGTEVMLDLLKYAKKALIPADYVLFDSWFTSPKTVHAVKELGYHVIGMVKKSPKMTFSYCGEKHSLSEIYRMNKKRRGCSKYLLSVEVGVEKDGVTIPARIVYVRNRTNRKEYLCILSTDTTLDEDEVIRIYGKRWQIECFFKVCKSYLRLSKECRSLSYDAMTAHVAVVFTRYMMLSVEHREEEDPRTLGELFLYFSEELADITWLQALTLVMDMFRKIVTEEFSVSSEKMEELVDTFLSVLTPSIQRQLKASAAN